MIAIALAAAAIQPAEIIVTGRIAADSSEGAVVIDRARLIENASGRIEEVLATIPSLQSFRRSDSRSSNPSAQGLTLRGLGGNASSRTLVLLDGVPIADPFFGFIPLSAINPDRLDKITVLKGAGGGPFGSAVAGAIDLVSVSPRARPPWTARAAASSGPAIEMGGGLTQSFGPSLLAIDGRVDLGRGFWTTPRSQRVPASSRASFAARSIDAQLLTPMAEGEVQARLMAYADDRTLRFDGADSHSTGLDASLRYAGNDGRSTLTAFVQRRDFANVVVSATSFRPVLDQYRTPAIGGGLMAQWRPVQWLSFGADARVQKGTAHERALSAATGKITAERSSGGTNRTLGLFAESELAFGQWQLSGSARAERWRIARGRFREEDGNGQLRADNRFNDREGTEFSGRLNLFRPGADADFRASAYRGTRLPTLNELYRGFTIFPVTTQANDALKPEVAMGAEAEVAVRPAPGLRLAATLFANRLAHAIANVTVAPNLRQRENVSAVESHGVEGSIEWRRGPWSVDGAVGLLKARIDDDGDLDGLRPAQVPARSLSLTAAYRTDRVSAAATLRHQSAAFDDDLNQDRLPHSTTIDLVYRQRIAKRLQLHVRAENLLDARTLTRNQAGSVDLGAPRTIWLGISM